MKKGVVKKAVAKKAVAKKATAKMSKRSAKAAKPAAASKKVTPQKSTGSSTTKKAASASKKPTAKKPATKKPAAKRAAGKAKPVTTTVAKPLSSVQPAEKPLKKISYLADTDKFKMLLRALRARLRGDVDMMSQEALGPDGNVDNRAPLHPAEVGTHSFEQEFTLNLLSSDGDRLAQIEAALEKISEGAYGACEECGGRIPKARLEWLPDAAYCVKCATKLEG